jgi:hypothetical protein
MHSLDQWTSRKAILPATKAAGRIFGVKEEDVRRMQEKHEEIKDNAWANRIGTITPQESRVAI